MKLQFTIRGMHCTACAASIERRVKKLDGTAKVYVNFAASLLTLDADPTLLSAETIIQTVKNAGFEAEPADNRFFVPSEKKRKNSNQVLLNSIIAMFFSMLLFYAAM